MTITLTWEDFSKLAANGTVDKDGATIKVGAGILPGINVLADPEDKFVAFTLDSSDPRNHA